ncbi:hypothetical protein QE152_g19685 [Popillia japonica]|uniref:Uncharacterized protein n=1 Tax=Popillia japonica TaxID=7064 RepID=A0AAW1KSA2_POPJA
MPPVWLEHATRLVGCKAIFSFNGLTTSLLTPNHQLPTQCCGIVPQNQDVFTEADYVAAECTDMPLQQPRPNQEEREARQTVDRILEAAEEDVEEESLLLEDSQDQTEAGHLQPGPSSRSQPDPPSSPQPGTSSIYNLDHLLDPNQIHPPVHNLGPLPAHKHPSL